MTRWSAFPVLVLAVFLATFPQAARADDETVTLRATVDERDVEGAGSSDPVEIDPSRVTTITLEVTNAGERDVTVRRARLYGEIVGLPLVAYDLSLDEQVVAGATRTLQMEVEFFDLEQQVTGLLAGGISLYDQDRNELATQSFVLDVKGSRSSILSLFAISIALLTAIVLVATLVAVSNRTLSRSRVRRMLRFGSIGLGVGLTLVIGLGVFRILAPSGAVWIPLLLIPTLIGAVLGFVSPGALSIDEAETLEIEDLETV